MQILVRIYHYTYIICHIYVYYVYRYIHSTVYLNIMYTYIMLGLDSYLLHILSLICCRFVCDVSVHSGAGCTLKLKRSERGTRLF